MDSRASDPIEIVRTVITALNRGDIDTALSLCDREIVVWAPGPDVMGQEIHGIEELRELLENAEERWPDTWSSIDSILASGDRVAVEMTTVASENGVALVQPIAAFFTVEDGRIVEQRSYYDLRALEHRLSG